jgi:hypothetical protein
LPFYRFSTRLRIRNNLSPLSLLIIFPYCTPIFSKV